MADNEIQKTAVAPQKTAVAPQKTAVASQVQQTATAQKTAVASGNASLSIRNKPVEAKYAQGDSIKAGSRNYTVEKVLGSGAEGDIYIVNDSKKRYALKLCHSGFHTNTKVMPALQKLKGQGYIADIVDYGDEFELLEYISEGSAASAGIKGNAEAITAITVRTALALDAMHRAGVIHKDVKPANILIKDRESWNSVLCDFGIADTLNNRQTSITEQARTPIYAAPEVYATNNTIFQEGMTYCELTPKADFYSLGMTILSLWMGEGSFLAKEAELAIDKTKGRIAIPADMPDPLAKICRGLLIKNPDKRWDLDEIERALKGEDVPADEDEIIEDLKIVFNASKHQIANTPEELAQYMAEDQDLATKYLYRGQIERWLKPYPELALEIQDIVEKRYPKDQDTGLLAAIYSLSPSWPFHLEGISRETGEAVSMNASTLKQIGDFCNAAVPDVDTAETINSDIFKEWVRIRNKGLADSLASSFDSSTNMLLRVQAVDPMSDINLRNDPSHPDYAMTQEAIGKLLNKIYTIFFNRFNGNFDTLVDMWNKDEFAPLNREIPLAVISNIAANFLAPEDFHYITEFFDLKGQRFKQQRSWFVYCTNRNSDDFKKKAGPKDDNSAAQISWMKVIKGYGVTPVYEQWQGKTACNREELFGKFDKKELKKEYEMHGLCGWLSVQHQEDPGADLKPQFAYEKLLQNYLEDLRRIDSQLTPVRRFDDARKVADKLLASGKADIRSLSIRSVLHYVLTIIFAILPGIILLAMLIFSIIDNPVLDTSGMNLEKYFWPIGLIVAVIIFFSTDIDGCVVPLIGGALAATAVFFLVRLLGGFILYIFAALVLAVLIFFSIKTVFFHSPYAKKARKFMRPGFDEKVLEPLYFAFSSESSFDSSLNGAFNQSQISSWRGDLKYRRTFMLIFIGSIWVLGLFSLLIPKSERFDKYSAPVLEKVQTWIPSTEKVEPLLDCTSLKQGDRGEDVVKLQQFLLDKEYTKNRPDGSFGPGTKKALEAFQKDNGLNPSGSAGVKTIEKINKIAAKDVKAERKAARKAAKQSKSETTQ